METARLLAKHRALSPQAAASLLRGLAAEQIAGAYDAEQLCQIWTALGPRERAMPELALRAAQRLIDLGGDAALARGWLLPVWDDMLAQPEFFTDAQRVRLAQVLEVQALSEQGADAEWLARIESSRPIRATPRCSTWPAWPACSAACGAGRAAAAGPGRPRALDDTQLRRDAWRAQARMAEERGDESAAAQAWRQAAQA